MEGQTGEWNKPRPGHNAGKAKEIDEGDEKKSDLAIVKQLAIIIARLFGAWHCMSWPFILTKN